MALATTGVLIQVVLIGHLPWIALTLAGSFWHLWSDPQTDPGRCPERPVRRNPVAAATGTHLPVWFRRFHDQQPGKQNGWNLNLLLAAGVVTTVPLLLFTAGARLIPLDP